MLTCSFGIEAATLVLGLIRWVGRAQQLSGGWHAATACMHVCSASPSNCTTACSHAYWKGSGHLCTITLPCHRSKAAAEENVWIGTSQGDCAYKYDEAMPRADFDQLDAARKRADESKPAIVVCHSLPFFWARPFLNEWTCAPCPPIGYTAALAIGRAMAETDMSVGSALFFLLCTPCIERSLGASCCMVSIPLPLALPPNISPPSATIRNL